MLSAVCNGHDKGSGDEVVGLSLPLLPPPYRLPKGHKAATWIREEFDDLKLLTGMSFSVSPESESQQVTVTNCGLGFFKDVLHDRHVLLVKKSRQPLEARRNATGSSMLRRYTRRSAESQHRFQQRPVPRLSRVHSTASFTSRKC